ncbi:protein LOL2-like [Dioscorea cayenensis subsp. rotundata]|uniref:Protein LOL2-like n=1 Tax=Dioscorea cayennensis subsp. rotundata TaxID=55577 RepID=A0AB40AKT6_DIOCR|nr:protein LOL2-like [Dioscorea cayenensis subsp. rotundata]
MDVETPSSPETAPPGWEHVSPVPPPQPPPEMGQMVCGKCRELISYPQGVIRVKCPCCQIVNFVLEAHQVGNVKCRGCDVLLMYPYGAPSVRCSCCRSVTEIDTHNMRPSVSVQQGQPPPPQHSSN